MVKSLHRSSYSRKTTCWPLDVICISHSNWKQTGTTLLNVHLPSWHGNGSLAASIFIPPPLTFQLYPWLVEFCLERHFSCLIFNLGTAGNLQCFNVTWKERNNSIFEGKNLSFFNALHERLAWWHFHLHLDMISVYLEHFWITGVCRKSPKLWRFYGYIPTPPPFYWVKNNMMGLRSVHLALLDWRVISRQ